MKKKKKLSGFTLLELIIVMAIFSAICVGAMAMIRPAMQLFHRTSSQEMAGADIDNITRYLQDNLKYADRVNIYYRYGDKDGDSNKKAITNVDDMMNLEIPGILPTVQQPTEPPVPPADPAVTTAKVYEKVYANATPLDFFRKYYYGTADLAEDQYKNRMIYVMEIAVDGKIKTYQYKLNKSETTEHFDSMNSINNEFYKKGSFSIPETGWDLSESKLKIEMNLDYDGVTRDENGDKVKLRQKAEINIPFVNIGTRSSYDVVEVATLPTEFNLSPNTMPANSYGNVENDFTQSGNVISRHTASSFRKFTPEESDSRYNKDSNTYIVYTLPEIIIP